MSSTDTNNNASTEKDDEEKKPQDIAAASSNKRFRGPSNNNRGKKKGKSNDRSYQRVAYDEIVDDRPPHEGSYANLEMRKEFGLAIEKPVLDPDVKLVKRKVALLLSFLGTNYGGFQINIHQRTLQAELEWALYKSGMLSEFNFGYPFKYSWSTSGRTDKGVHACGQVCSLKVEIPESLLDDSEAIRQNLQEHLPSDICVLDVCRTTRAFCAKTQRDRVRYQYMLPSFCLHPDWRSVLELHEIPLTGREQVAREPLSNEEVQKMKGTLRDYRSTKGQRDLLQSALKKYEGTHPFHNFTKGMKSSDPSAKRFIVSFDAQDPIIENGVEWIPTQVLGQSFLLHQIRKMVSLAVDVARGVAPLQVMDRALSDDTLVVGLAPAQGLFLELSIYGGYNRKKKQTQNKELPDLDWTVDGPVKDRWEEFRKVIRKHIVEEEDAQGNFVQYLYQQESFFDHREVYKLDEKKGAVKESNDEDQTDNPKEEAKE
jgi:tRNA pseudouridine38-40 synthase